MFSTALLPEVLATLFPEGVALALSTEPGDPAVLWPEEYAPLAKAIPKRLKEFAAGRACARAALRSLGYADVVLPSLEDRRPAWPPGVVGSITHTTGLCAAVVSSAARHGGLGIDAEVLGRVGEHLYKQVCTPPETEWLLSLDEASRSAMATLVFSAKEAFYKAQYTLTEQFLGFGDARLELLDWQGDSGHFAIHLLRDARLSQLHPAPTPGRFRIAQGLIVTGVAFAAL